MISTTNQLAQFLYAIYAGIIIGLLFDGFKVFKSSNKNILNSLLDIAFWCGAFIVAFYALLKANSMNLRLFMFFGFAIGAALYFATFSKIVDKVTGYCKTQVKSKLQKLADLLN